MTPTPPPLHGPEFEADPHPAYRWLRENEPVHRMEARVAVGAVLDRLPGLRLSFPESELRWWPSMIMHGLFALPVTFDPAG